MKERSSERKPIVTGEEKNLWNNLETATRKQAWRKTGEQIRIEGSGEVRRNRMKMRKQRRKEETPLKERERDRDRESRKRV